MNGEKPWHFNESAILIQFKTDNKTNGYDYD